MVCVCVYRAYNVTDTWNGWLTQYNAGLVLSQQFAAVQLVLYFSTFSSPTAVACLHFTLHYLNCLMLPQLPHFASICTALSIGRQSIVMSMSVYVCVCLSTIKSLELHVRSSPNFCACDLWPWLSASLAA